MTTSTFSTLRKTGQLVLSTPVQACLFLSLGSLTIWMLYFSSYPATHDAMHQIRHETLGVGCH
ncbi:MAG: CbtB domain-containing protein [Thermosynechococcaceae cyanobacterium]